ncbi:MAG TPA: sn-glycerol-3-phosphate ABC transporter ATP-binding protein UgpC [Acidimicrobiales bacterium]|nr:sn-glycerol-3-phosphate ABC transporter ATP-binding protein UgpC [Acidimicrobiales bacterium]
MASISLNSVTKVYPNGYEAIHGLDLEIADGEFMVMVGPSGCGKTTVLRMIAGLEEVSSGTVKIDDEVVNDVAPRDRDIAMVFQSYALYPHMSVAQNIGFALRMKKLPKAEIDRRVRDAASVLGITDWLSRKPAQLSGGQRQRVAMGRAIVREPSVFLMDEPLSNLDAKLRVQMRAEVARVQKRIGVATLYVTHDQTEAMTLGHRVAVMRAGVLQQCDAPQTLYDRPTNLFVAGFIGSPSMNLIEARLSDDLTSFSMGSQTVSLPTDIFERRPRLRGFAGQMVVVGIRPEDLHAPNANRPGVDVSGVVELVEALGAELLVHFSMDAKLVQSELSKHADESGEEVTDTGQVAVARIEPGYAVRAGDKFTFRVDPQRFEFFDGATEQAIWI